MHHTMAQFEAAFYAACLRRAGLEAQLSDRARAVVAMMTRPPTTDELALFTAVPIEWIEATIASMMTAASKAPLRATGQQRQHLQQQHGQAGLKFRQQLQQQV